VTSEGHAPGPPQAVLGCLLQRPRTHHCRAGIVTAQRLRDVAAAEATVAPPTLAFLQAALPAAPALVLGFVFLEGRSLVRP